MRTVLIIRHAKARRGDRWPDDHDRPLSGRGRRDAPRVGALVASQGLAPDLIVCSTARRARATARRVRRGGGFDCPLEQRDDLYMAGAAAILDVVRSWPPGSARVMLVGHNPGLEELLAMLTGAAETLPTCAVARVDLDVESWSDAGPGSGVLRDLWRPREIV